MEFNNQIKLNNLYQIIEIYYLKNKLPYKAYKKQKNYRRVIFP